MRKREKNNFVFQENRLLSAKNISNAGRKKTTLAASSILSFSIDTVLPRKVTEGGGL